MKRVYLYLHLDLQQYIHGFSIAWAGSFFKNPSIQADLLDLIRKDHPTIPTFPSENKLIKIPAAWLIEQCGWKGKTFDNIGVHKDQALVLVNYGGGKGENIWQLAMKIQQSVREKFNITLQPEVNVIAWWWSSSLHFKWRFSISKILLSKKFFVKNFCR